MSTLTSCQNKLESVINQMKTQDDLIQQILLEITKTGDERKIQKASEIMKSYRPTEQILASFPGSL